MKLTEENYRANIPKCCDLDFQGHKDMMLCWGLLSDLEQDIIRTECPVTCDCHKNHDPELLHKILTAEEGKDESVL
jgi:hypothetical protein